MFQHSPGVSVNVGVALLKKGHPEATYKFADGAVMWRKKKRGHKACPLSRETILSVLCYSSI
jgi:hypothetical protein